MSLYCARRISNVILDAPISLIQTCFACGCRTLICLDIDPYYVEAVPKNWFCMEGLHQKTVNRDSIAGGRSFSKTICTAVCQNRCDRSTNCRLCHMELCPRTFQDQGNASFSLVMCTSYIFVLVWLLWTPTSMLVWRYLSII